MPVTKPKQVVLLLCMTYLTFVFDVPYYYVKGENFLFPISFIYHNADTILILFYICIGNSANKQI